MNIKEIKEMLQLMAEHNLTEVEIEKDGLKIKLRKGGNGKIIAEESHQTSFPAPIPVPVVRSSDAPVGHAKLAEPSNSHVVKSPMVGTFYTAPSPDQPPYVATGKKIKEGDVLCIIEAMKLMNEIKAEISGTVVEILAKNGQPVEFDQPLFKVQKG